MRAIAHDRHAGYTSSDKTDRRVGLFCGRDVWKGEGPPEPLQPEWRPTAAPLSVRDRGARGGSAGASPSRALRSRSIMDMHQQQDTIPHVDRQAERRSSTRRRILDAAVGIFAEKGYHDTAVDDIARASKTSKGAIYFH